MRSFCPGSNRDELLTAMQAMQKREQSMLDALRWAAVDAGRDKLVAIVQAMQIREESMLELLRRNHGLLDVPHEVLRASLPIHSDHTAEYIQEDIEYWLCNPHNRSRYCDHFAHKDEHFDGPVFEQDVELLRSVEVSPHQSIGVVAAAIGHLATHANGCVASCKMHIIKECDRIMLSLIQDVQGKFYHWREFGSMASLVRNASQEQEYRVKLRNESWDTNVVFKDSMACIRDEHLKTTAAVLARRVVGHELPQELVDEIAEWYIFDHLNSRLGAGGPGMRPTLGMDCGSQDEHFARFAQI